MLKRRRGGEGEERVYIRLKRVYSRLKMTREKRRKGIKMKRRIDKRENDKRRKD